MNLQKLYNINRKAIEKVRVHVIPKYTKYSFKTVRGLNFKTIQGAQSLSKLY